MFRTAPLSIIRSFQLYIQQWYMLYMFVDSLRAGRGWILILLVSCQQNCMTYTIAVCTVINSWWWTEELSETFRVLLQNKFEELVHLFGCIVRIFQEARSPESQKRTLHFQKKKKEKRKLYWYNYKLHMIVITKPITCFKIKYSAFFLRNVSSYTCVCVCVCDSHTTQRFLHQQHYLVANYNACTLSPLWDRNWILRHE